MRHSLAGALALVAVTLAAGARPQPVAPAAGITFAKARRILLDQVVKPKALRPGDHLVAFALRKPLGVGQRVSPFRGLGRAARVVTGPQWFFWVDDDPKAQFVHPTRYVFVDARSGRVRVFRQLWWPLVDGHAPWLAFDDYWNPKNWAFSTLKPPQRPKASRAASSASRATSECALIVQGSDDARAGFPEDVSGMERVMGTTFGFTTRTLRPPRNERDDLKRALQDLVDDGCRDVLVYIASHGDTGRVLLGSGMLEAPDLAQLLGRHQGVDFKVVVQACRSGSWLQALAGVANVRIAIASSSATEPSYSADPDSSTDTNASDAGSEFSSGLIEDLESIPGQEALLGQIRVCQEAGRPLLVCKLELAFRSAVAKDEDAQLGRTHPQRS